MIFTAKSIRVYKENTLFCFSTKEYIILLYFLLVLLA